MYSVPGRLTVALGWKDDVPGMGPYPPPVALALCTSSSQSATSQWRWDFHAVRAGIDPGERLLRLRVVVFVSGLSKL